MFASVLIKPLFSIISLITNSKNIKAKITIIIIPETYPLAVILVIFFPKIIFNAKTSNKRLTA